MNAILISEKQAKMLLWLLIIALAAGAFFYFYSRAQKKKQSLAAAEPDAPLSKAEQRIHQHIAFARQEAAAGLP